MRALIGTIGVGSRALSMFLGLLVIGLTVAVLATARDVGAIAAWAHHVFGITFLGLLAALVLSALYYWMRLNDVAAGDHRQRVWLEKGLQAANGVATLALTYTLLGVSLGIGTLAEQELTPATVQSVIRSLTDQFSLAFLTTVVGLPTSAALRALLQIRNARLATAPDRCVALPKGDLS
jgi:hypothetical protein